MTLRTFNKFYKCYKDNFDLELSLKLSRTTYANAKEKSVEQEEWI